MNNFEPPRVNPPSTSTAVAIETLVIAHEPLMLFAKKISGSVGKGGKN